MLHALAQLEQQLKPTGIRVHIYSGKRTLAQQLTRLAAGHTTIVRSRHLDGEAADLILSRGALPSPRSDYTLAGQYWTKLGGIWGGNFKDPELARAEYQHYEAPLSSKTTQLSGMVSASRQRRSLPARRSGTRSSSRSHSAKLKLAVRSRR